MKKPYKWANFQTVTYIEAQGLGMRLACKQRYPKPQFILWYTVYIIYHTGIQGEAVKSTSCISNLITEPLVYSSTLCLWLRGSDQCSLL